MAKPVNNKLVADAVKMQMLPLIKANLKLRFALAVHNTPQVSDDTINIKNQGLANALSELNHQTSSSINKNAKFATPKTTLFWEASGKHQGHIWEASGRHLGGIWEGSGRHLGHQEA